MKGNTHESFEAHVAVRGGSERSFGWVVGSVLLLIALWPLLHADGPRLWALVPALLLIGFALIYPAALRSLNQLWFRLGLLLGRIVSPIVLGVIYFLWITPFAIALRLMKKKLLALGNCYLEKAIKILPRSSTTATASSSIDPLRRP